MENKYLDSVGAQYLIDKMLSLLSKKVDIEEGKGLSEENFTTLLKNKLEQQELNISVQDNLLIIEKGE